MAEDQAQEDRRRSPPTRSTTTFTPQARKIENAETRMVHTDAAARPRRRERQVNPRSQAADASDCRLPFCNVDPQ